MVDLPDGPLASIFLLIPIPEGGTVSAVCRSWHRILRDVVHNTMVHELNVQNAASDMMIRTIAGRFQNLARLVLNDCRQVSDDVGVQAIGAGCPSLTGLNLFNCRQVSDVGVQAIGAGCPSLTGLDLYSCGQVSDVGVQAIGAGCPSLTNFYLSIGYQLTMSGKPRINQAYADT